MSARGRSRALTLADAITGRCCLEISRESSEQRLGEYLYEDREEQSDERKSGMSFKNRRTSANGRGSGRSSAVNCPAGRRALGEVRSMGESVEIGDLVESEAAWAGGGELGVQVGEGESVALGVGGVSGAGE